MRGGRARDISRRFGWDRPQRHLSAWNVYRGGWSSGLFCSFLPQAARRRGLTRVLVTWIVRSQAIIKPHDSRHMSGHLTCNCSFNPRSRSEEHGVRLMFQQSKQAQSLVSSSLSSPGVALGWFSLNVCCAGPHPYSFCVRRSGWGRGDGALRICISAKLPAPATAAGGGHTLALSHLLKVWATFTRDRPVALGQLSPLHCVLPWNETRQLLTGRQGHVTRGEGERTAVGEAQPAKPSRTGNPARSQAPGGNRGLESMSWGFSCASLPTALQASVLSPGRRGESPGSFRESRCLAAGRTWAEHLGSLGTGPVL